MPMRPPTGCWYSGCPTLVRKGRVGCDVHKTIKHQESQAVRGTGHQRGYDHVWFRLRAMHLREFPLCCACAAPATLVHHRVPLNDGGERLSQENLASMCKPCHEGEHKRIEERKKAQCPPGR